MRTLLKLSDISYRNSARTGWLFTKVNITVNTGEKIAIFGPAGSGKTTLAELMVGLKRPELGWVERSGAIALVTQDFSLYPELTVGENLKFFGTINDFGAEAQNELLNSLGLEEWENVRGSQLPATLKKVLLLAVALTRQFSVLILDETFSSLDDYYRVKVGGLLTKLVASEKAIIFFTSARLEARQCQRHFELSERTLLELVNSDVTDQTVEEVAE